MSSPHVLIQNLQVLFGKKQVLKNVSLEIPRHQITAIIGPSGCGKTTLLKSINRLLELQDRVSIQGEVLLDNRNIYEEGVDVTEVRTRIGMLAQKPFPLPMSIYNNVAYGRRIHNLREPDLSVAVQTQLQAVGLWEEVKDRLKAPAGRLSVGQQQRLCLARALAIEPEVLLCDESTSALDPISARGIENLLVSLKSHYTILMVTHNLAQAQRIADHVVFLWLGEVVEAGTTAQLFENPRESRTRDYISGEVS